MLEISESSPIWNRAACSAACLCNSSRSSSFESLDVPKGSSVLRWVRRSALSRCFCWRVCSFWRLVKLDRPLPGIPVSNRHFCGSVDLNQAALSNREFLIPPRLDYTKLSVIATSGVRGAGERGPDNHRGCRLHRRRQSVFHLRLR